MALMSQDDVKRQLSQRVDNILKSTPSYQKDLIAQSAAAYEKKWHTKMTKEKMAVLANSVTHMENKLLERGFTRDKISSAVADITKTDNPITMLFSLMSIIIPNFAYTEVIGMQPLPTKKSPIYFPVIEAKDSRNGVSAGTQLLGATNWNTRYTYSTNRNSVDGASSATGTAVSWTASEANIVPGTFVAKLYISGTGTAIITDDGKGAIPEVTGYTSGAGTINYSTGAVSFTLAASLGGSDTLTFSYRYEFADSTKPAQIVLKWDDKPVRAEPYRLRSTYELDNFYQAKQVLSGYDIDEVMSTSLAGYINAEISGNVFDDMLLKADADYSWSKTPSAGVSWALHRLSIVQAYVEAGNGIRQNIKRAGGNVVVCGTDHMNVIETLGEDLWKPVSTNGNEPIGPYVAGTLANRFKILKHQEFPTAKAVMSYKSSETEASVLGGSYISLYSTPPLAMDDLNVVQGMGTQMGYEKVFDNSIVSLTVN